MKSRHVAVAGSAVRVYCSAQCLATWDAPLVSLEALAEEAPGASRTLRAGGIAIGLGMLALFHGGHMDPSPEPAAAIAATEAEQAAVDEAAARAEEARLAALREQAERERQEAEWVAELMKDVWLHPLAGPTRHMPRNHNQAFGAERPGDRPIECLSGHCGVDLGGGMWGEPVRAVNDGVVDRVNRGPNEDHGGIYVRLAHRDGTVFTWYFHLAAVPRWVRPGVRIEAGDVIGVIGDTGIKSSAPHLHFAMSVKPSPESPERYLDPEPLIALWPLWVPDEKDGTARRPSVEPPGLPARGRASAKPRSKAQPPGDPPVVVKPDVAVVKPASPNAAPAPAAPAPGPQAPALPSPDQP